MREWNQEMREVRQKRKMDIMGQETREVALKMDLKREEEMRLVVKEARELTGKHFEQLRCDLPEELVDTGAAMTFVREEVVAAQHLPVLDQQQ
ncbi:hypothetical protein E2C01_079892 [Portunus trituberculatus]|uniref:Uncharacterized protein n=1 Tax=Portunus trituberculatus TaxID=210409 RepID=A0A5B7IMN8_PORTR|nr:hypothetical protein [Portunus trituberculatus]